MPKETDAKLVEMVRERGDIAAYGQLIMRYQGHAQGLAYSILGDWTEAQDMAQDAFIRAYVNLHTLEKPEKFPAWLARIVFSTCIRWLQTFRPELYRSMGEPENLDKLKEIPGSQIPTPLESALKSEMSEVVLAAIADLPRRYRIPITMFHLDGLSYQRVADFLEIPINTVKTLISRARGKLRLALESYAEEVLPMVKEALDEHKLTAEFAEETMRILNYPDKDTNYEVRAFGELLALRDSMSCCGVEADWHDILGHSTDAFGCDNMDYDSVRVHDPVLLAAQAYGFGEAKWAFGEEGSLEDIRSQIDGGQPVITGGSSVCWYFLAVSGYDTTRNHLRVAGLGHPTSWVPAPSEDGVPGRWNAQCPWATGAPTVKERRINWHASPRFLLGKRDGSLPSAETFIRSLKLGIYAYHSQPLEMYWGSEEWRNILGREYLVQWRQLLKEWANEIRQQSIDPNDGDPLTPGYFNPIAISVRRHAAADFLRKHASELATPMRPHIENAASQYLKSVEAADQIFDALYAVDALSKLDWKGKLASVQWYIGEGPGMAIAVAAYAKTYPERWAMRAAVIERVNRTFADDYAVNKARELISSIIESEDAAVAEIEKALGTV